MNGFKWLGAGAALAAGLMAGPALAQTSGDFSGVYAFQSDNYMTDGSIGVVSGIVRSTPLGGGYYSIMLYAIDYHSSADGEYRVTADQSCDGARNGPVLTITCRVNDTNGENYQPDNFTLRQVNAWEWSGTLNSAGSAGAVFVHYGD